MRPPEYYRQKEQTYVKHFFLEQYLEKVAFHIGYGYREFVYVDCFSGPWQSQDEEFADTSIRISLDRLNYVRTGLAAQGRYADIRAIFIEKSPTAFDALQAALNQHRGSIKTTALQGAFEDNIQRILAEIGSAFAFFFIDPKGWTGFAMDNIRPILLHKPGEVMVNFMYDFVNRFLDFPNAANEQSLDRLFGNPSWRRVRDSRDREVESVGLYIEQIRSAGGFTYATSTRILKPLSDRAYFHLVYATRSPTGILKFREAEKKVFDEQEVVRSAAQRQDREQRTGQFEMPFPLTAESGHSQREERAVQLKKAEAKVLELLRGGPLLYERLQPMILELPLVWNADLNMILVGARRAGQIVIDGFADRQRSPKEGNLIRLA
jgi:three-Cys-motif partner protein